PGALAQVAALAGLLPRLAAVARAEDTAFFRLDDRVDVLRIRRRDAHADDAERAFRQAFTLRDVFPCVAAVRRLPERRAVAAALEAVGRAPHAPCRGVEDARIG